MNQQNIIIKKWKKSEVLWKKCVENSFKDKKLPVFVDYKYYQAKDKGLQRNLKKIKNCFYWVNRGE